MDKMFKNDKCWPGYGERGRISHFWWEWELAQPLWESVWRFFRKVEINLPNSPALPTLGICTESSISNYRGTCSSMFTAVREWRWLRWASADGQIRKMWFSRKGK